VLGQRFRAAFLQSVVLPLPSCPGGAHVGFDESLFLQAVQDGIEHAVGPLHLAAGQLADPLDDGVAVAVALGEDGQDQRRRRSRNQIL
jgi:hypothetical protein